MGMTRAQMNKSVRQKALREQLEGQGHVQHVVEILNKISDLDSMDLQRLKVVVDTKLKLITKYLPDLKSVEHSGDEDSPVQVQIAAYELKFTDDPDP